MDCNVVFLCMEEARAVPSHTAGLNDSLAWFCSVWLKSGFCSDSRWLWKQRGPNVAQCTGDPCLIWARPEPDSGQNCSRVSLFWVGASEVLPDLAGTRVRLEPLCYIPLIQIQMSIWNVFHLNWLYGIVQVEMTSKQTIDLPCKHQQQLRWYWYWSW